jgi:hypothetical protein
MKTYLPLIALAVAFAVIIGVSCYTYPSNQSQQDNTQKGLPTTASPANADHASNHTETPKTTPYLAMLFEWPHGVETLALIATLFVVAWQATLLAEHAKHFENLAKAASDNACAAKASAKAALLQSKHTEATERAWLLINFVSMEKKELKEGEVADCRWAIKNVGSTPAILLETKTRFQAIRLHNEMPEDPVKLLPAIPDYGKAITINERLLAPQDTIGYFTKWERNIDGKFCEFAFPLKDKDIWMVVAYGYVKYKDIFGVERESRSCDFVVVGIDGRIIMEFRPHPNVPGAYNRCT